MTFTALNKFSGRLSPLYPPNNALIKAFSILILSLKHVYSFGLMGQNLQMYLHLSIKIN